MTAMRRLLFPAVLLLAGPVLAQGFTTREIAHDGDLVGVAALMPLSGAEFLAAWNTERESPDALPQMAVATAGQVVTFALFASGVSRSEGQAALTCHVAFLTREGEGQVVQDGPCMDDAMAGPGDGIRPAYLFDFRVPQGFAGEIIAIRGQMTDQGNGNTVSMRLAVPVVAAGEAGE